LEKQHILELKLSEADSSSKQQGLQLLEHASSLESKENHIQYLEGTLAQHEADLVAKEQRLEQTYNQKLSELKQMFSSNRDENEKT